jgi:iron(III) transport system ATP-binding protein
VFNASTGKLRFYDYEVEMDTVDISALPEKNGEIPVKVSVRPEEFGLSDNNSGIEALIEQSVFLGLNTHYFAVLKGGEKVEIIQESTIDQTLPVGSRVYLTVKREKINVFSADGELSYIKGVREDGETKA